jgi:glycosyltransferase involved in cell wall biosynthesis
MNVLYLIHHAGQGGTEKYVLSVAQKLREKGAVTPFFAYTEDGLLRKWMEDMEIPVFQIAMPGRFSLSAAKTIAGLCREHRIEVIHTQFLRENYLALLSKRYCKTPRVIYTNHIILSNDLITRISNRFLSRRQHAVFALCGSGRERLIQNGIPSKKIAVIHNGVDPFPCSRKGDPVFTMLYPARFAEGKGHAFLLEAVSRLKTETKHPFRLILAGDGPLLDDIKMMAERLELPVSFPGFCEDMRALFGTADLCVNPSAAENFSMSILEGMAAGLPVVATGVGGTPELVDGESGILVGYGHTGEMAAALRVMLEEPDRRAAYAEKALARIQEGFTAQIMADKIYSYYLGGKPSG